MSYKTHISGPSRFFDHVYDPIYTSSAAKNVRNSNYMALAMSAPVQIFPIYQNMFTDLPRRPRNYYVPLQNPLPHYSYYDGGEHHIENKSCDIRGVDRIKYFKSALAKPKSFADFEIKEEIVETVTQNREIGCQTLYRESSAQTKPWMPNARIGDGEPVTPEVVYVADLISNDRQPGVIEAEIVERSRKRRKWEKTFKEIQSNCDWYKKRTVIQAFEWEEWVAREEEIQEFQRLRLQIVHKLLEKRENKHRTVKEIRLENYNKRVLTEKERKLTKAKNEYQREMRKLQMRHNKISKKYKPIDVATEQIDHASDLYGPQLRFGAHPRQKHFKVFKTEIEPRCENLDDIELKLPEIRNMIKSKDKEKLWDPKQKIKEIQRYLWTDNFLTNLHKSLKELRASRETPKNKNPKCLIPIPKAENIEIPSIQAKTVIDDTEYQNTLYLQKIIKGRAIQNILYRGRQKCRSLIAELQSVQQLSAVTELYSKNTSTINEKKQQVLVQQNMYESCLQANEQIQELPSQEDGAYMISLFDFLGTELVRLNDQKTTHALYLLAEEERYRREAKEAGLRQVEDWVRKENETVYHQRMRSTNDTVSMYLENVLVNSMEKMSEEEAVEKVREIAHRIDLLANEKLKTNEEEDVEIILNEFVFPEVTKRLERQEKRNAENVHLLAAHNVLYNILDEFPLITKSETPAEKIANSIIDQILEEIPEDKLFKGLSGLFFGNSA